MRSGFHKYLKKSLPLLIEIIVLVLLIPGALKGNVPVLELTESDFTYSSDSEEAYISSNIVIPRGFLQADVKTKVQDREYLIETKRLDIGTYYGMECNDIRIFSGMDSVSYEIYVTDKEAHVNFVLRGVESPTCPIESVTIYNTHRANRVLVSLLFIFFVFIDLLIYKRKKIIEKDNHNKEYTFLILAGVTFVSLLPEMNDYLVFGSRGIDSIVKIETMLKVLRGNGSFLPAHLKDLYLIIPVLLRWIGFPIIVAYKANIVIISAATAFISYKLVRICGGKSRLALVLTIIYILCPYRLYVLYDLCDMRELTAMAFPPLVVLPLIHLNKEVIKNYFDTNLISSCIWGLSGITSIVCFKKKYVTELAIVFIIIVSMYFLGETAVDRPAVWLYSIESFYRL